MKYGFILTCSPAISITKIDLNKMEEEFEREIFEKWIGSPPFEHSCERNSESSAWPGSYKRYETELAWEAWKERANYALTNKS